MISSNSVNTKNLVAHEISETYFSIQEEGKAKEELAAILSDGSKWYPEFSGCLNLDANVLRFTANILDKLNKSEAPRPITHQDSPYCNLSWSVKESNDDYHESLSFAEAVKTSERINALALRVANGQDGRSLTSFHPVIYATIVMDGEK